MNIKEVAAYAKVSVATVSRVLNDDPSVAPKTSEAVRKAIAETGYVRSALGRNLRRAQSDVVLVVLPNMNNPFYADIVKGIDSRCKDYGLSAMACNTYDSYEKLKYFCDFIEKRQARGVIIVSAPWKRDYSFLEGLPVVGCCESREDMPCAQVDIDNVQAGYDATKYLISLGAKRIALIGGGEISPSNIKREQGYRLAMRDAGYPIDESLVVNNCYNYEQGSAVAKRILNASPDALFAAADEIAVSFINAAQDMGISIPDELKIFGFDNVHYSTFVKPKLSTIDQPRYEMGVQSVDQLMRVLDGKRARTVMCQYKLIRRGSTEKGVL